MCQETEGVAEKRLIVGNVLDTVPSIVVAYPNVRRLEWDALSLSGMLCTDESDLPSERRVRVTIHAQKLEARGSVNWAALQAQKRRKRGWTGGCRCLDARLPPARSKVVGICLLRTRNHVGLGCS